MKYWFDTEFIDDGKTIDLISIGIVCEDGRKYYSVSNQFNGMGLTDWHKENIMPHLCAYEYRKTKQAIAQEIRDFVRYDKPEFWSYYGAYDWVCLCQLFGPMMKIPEGWPYYTRDIKQLAESKGDPKLPEQLSVEHHALNDAYWNKQAWEFLNSLPEKAS